MGIVIGSCMSEETGPSGSVVNSSATTNAARPDSSDVQSHRLTFSDDRNRLPPLLVPYGANLRESIAQWRSLHMRRLISGEFLPKEPV